MAKKKLFTKKSFYVLVLFLVIPVILVSINIQITSFQGNENNAIMHYCDNEGYFNSMINLSNKSLPGKEFVEYLQSDFRSEIDNKFIDVTIVFKDNVIWNFPDTNFNYRYKYLNGFKASIPERMYNFLKEKSFVKYIYENKNYNITLENDDLNWGVDHTQAEHVWGGSEDAQDIIEGYPSGSGVKVVIMDTGMDYYHSDLDNNYAGGYDFADEDNNPIDEAAEPLNGHGTMVAGFIGAEDNGEDVIGAAPEALIYALKVITKEWNEYEGEYIQILNNPEEAMEWAIEYEIDVINLSWGTTASLTTFHDLCDIAYGHGITLVASAGNNGLNISSHFPSCWSSVIQVGAVGRLNQLTDYSNWGLHQDFVAPGGTFYDKLKTTVCDGGTGFGYGTSFAAPMVSGVCALLHSLTPNIMPIEIRYILNNTAIDHGDIGWDQYYGWGMIDAEAAINFANSTDSDTDGIIDVLETNIWGTNPSDSDSDNDGLTDTEEVRIYHSNPLTIDTDKDSLTDYDEVTDYETDPTDEDTDNDGYHDQIELELNYDPCNNNHHPQQSFLFEDGTGATNTWTATDSPYNTVTENYLKEGYSTVRNTEYTTHYNYDMFAKSTAIDLSTWEGENNLHITFRFRCQSDYSSSSVTQFQLKFYDANTAQYISYENPTDYSYYFVFQSNRNGQTWISGKDSGWQTVSFTLLSSEFDEFIGTDDRLYILWGHHDSWSTDWDQTEYIDYLMLSEEDNAVVPDQPRSFSGLGDDISHILLFWKSPLNVLADKYIIERKVNGVYTWQANITHSGGIEMNQYWLDEDELSIGVTYYYRICAVNGELVGEYAYWSGTV